MPDVYFNFTSLISALYMRTVWYTIVVYRLLDWKHNINTNTYTTLMLNTFGDALTRDAVSLNLFYQYFGRFRRSHFPIACLMLVWHQTHSQGGMGGSAWRQTSPIHRMRAWARKSKKYFKHPFLRQDSIFHAVSVFLPCCKLFQKSLPCMKLLTAENALLFILAVATIVIISKIITLRIPTMITIPVYIPHFLFLFLFFCFVLFYIYIYIFYYRNAGLNSRS